MLKLNKLGDAIALSAVVRSSDGRIVAEITDNKFAVNPNNSFRTEAPNNSTLIVRDQTGKEVLRVHYVNKQMVQITGIFYAPGLPGPLIVSDEAINFPDGGIMRNTCLATDSIGLLIETD